MKKEDISTLEAEIKFCPSCGHEGNDLICPVCSEKMELLSDAVDKISEKENKKSDIFDDEVSLEEAQEKEVQEQGTVHEEDSDL
ncbi:MAG: hypothetical protein OEV37_03160 [Candidatus Berkelbacteria bacterium]|nr:hypothetical protein [Candidatus Berkelbacteria bacterium]